uniref:Septin-7 n=1 Tax=Pundamilia nyererei TaxID=303518 RepID=A0A3B4GQV7_9CICH
MVSFLSGLGKSTLINSLFLTDLYKDRKVLNAEERISRTVAIIKHTVGIEEKGVKLRLTIIDTPGFGDAVNNTERHIDDYIDQQFEQYFRDESGLNRRNIQDNRVHCCLYFISPFGHGLRPLDVDCMRALHEKVNIIPVLAKADSLTPAEVCRKKMKVTEIKQFGINIYQFPECDSDEDEDFKTQEQILKNSIPFAVIGSNVQVESKGRKFRGRVYPWGVVEGITPKYILYFLLLRNMLVRTHMQDLKDVTREIHYENYRAQCIQNMTRMVVLERKRRWVELRKMQEVLERIQEQMQHSHRGGC